MEQFAEYGHALVSIALFGAVLLALSPFIALAKGSAGVESGGTPPEDYTNKTYRLHRAYQNGAETLPVFIAVTIVAIAAGASPFWVNLLASLVLVSRLLMLFLHLRGVGKPFSGVRSFTYVFGWACMALLAVLGVLAVF